MNQARVLDASSTRALGFVRVSLAWTGLTLALVVLLTGCQPEADLPAPHTPSTSAAGDSVVVQQVFDGDTLEVRTEDGSVFKVRMLGIDAPERGSCGADEATARLRELLARGTTVVLVADPKADQQDRFGRTLAYVDSDGVDIGEQLVDEGMVGVWWPSGEPKPVRASGYQELESQAKANKTGSWRICARLGR